MRGHLVQVNTAGLASLSVAAATSQLDLVPW